MLRKEARFGNSPWIWELTSIQELRKTRFGNSLGRGRPDLGTPPDLGTSWGRGFGKSLNDYVLKTCDYVNIIDEFLLEYKQMLCCIVGHSFGGKIATALNPPTLVLLSSAGIIERKSLQVRFKIECVKWLKYFGLGNFSIFFRSRDVKNMPQNMYETFKNVVDEKFEDSFQLYTNRALIFWGEQDVSTSLQSGKRIAALIQHSKFYTYAGNHYFFIKYAQDISQRIEDAIL